MSKQIIDLIERLSALPADQLEQTFALLTDGHELDTEELLSRSVCHTLRYERGQETEELGAALDDLHLLSRRVDVVDYAATLWTLVRQLRGALMGRPVDIGKARAVLDKSGPDPYDASSPIALRALLIGADAMSSESPAVLEKARADLAEVRRAMPANSQFAHIFVQVRQALDAKIGYLRGDYGVGRRLADHIRANPGQNLDIDPDDSAMRITALVGEMSAASHRGDFVQAAELLDKVKPLMAEGPADEPLIAYTRKLMGVADQLLEPHRGGGLRPDAARPWPQMPPIGPDIFPEDVLSALRPNDRATLAQARTHNQFLQALQRGDTDGIRRAIVDARQILTLTEEDGPTRADHRGHLGAMLLTLYYLTFDTSVLAETTTELERAAEEAGGPSHMYWSTICLGLFRAYRFARRDDDAREWGERGLRGHAWSVLLQDRTIDATAAAERGARDDAIEVSREYLAKGKTDAAAMTLDAGRGLLLHAAATTTSVAARLRAKGADDLAVRWEAALDSHADDDVDLRYSVLTALVGDASGSAEPGGLLSPPTLAETRAALGTVGADALVYLVPADDHGPGLAVVVPRTEETFRLRLPQLTAPPNTWREHRMAGDPRIVVPASTLEAQASRELRPRSAPRRDDVCGWTWSVAMGQLIDAFPGRAEPVRLVLVPVGDLATVPWHAARSPAGRYAVESAVISYAASARLLCEVAWRHPLDYDQGGLIVADPMTNLPDARKEAEAVGAAFYPDALQLGDGTADTPASPSAVLAWLSGGSGRSALHLACHGFVGSGGGDDTYLQLADDKRLTAREIVETHNVVPVDVVSLAACTTAVAAGSYDEAFSLSTAFLVAGARTVFGSLWAVPSYATSLLMFMTHHYLRAEGLRPADALRRAQLWMIDRERRFPDTMPASLIEHARNAQLEEMDSWAAFTHLGR